MSTAREVRDTIIELAEAWEQDLLAPAPLSRITVCGDIAETDDATWNRVRSAVRAALDAPAPAPVPPPVTQPTLFEKAGVMVYAWPNFDGNAARKAKASGFGWIVGLDHEGVNPPVPNGHIPSLRLMEWWDAGLKVGCSGYCKGDPVKIAEAANGIINHRGYDFYIANAEAETPREFDRPFLARFRELQPTIPLALSTNPDDPRDWAAWREAGATPMFQAYLNVNPAVTPLECEFKAQQHGFPAGAQKPTIGLYPPKTVTADRYVDLLADTGVKGFSVYLGEHLTASDWDVLARGIRGGIARV